LEPGDVITEAGGRPVLTPKDIEEALKGVSPDRGILLLIERSGSRTFAILKP
jgi:S1-C subfamily serine protease